MDAPSPSEDFAAAARLHQSGDLAAAAAAYRRVLEGWPRHPDAQHMLGVLEHQRGRHAEAVGLITMAIGLAPARPDYRNNLGVALKALGRLDEAIAAYREAARLDPAYADALANLGVALHASGRPAEAVDSLGSALRADPGHVPALFALANLRLEAGDPSEAIPLYRRAHALSPRRGDVLNNLGNALQSLDRLDEALASFRLAAEVDPGDPAVLPNLGLALERQGRVEEAAEAYVAAARRRPFEPHWPIRIASLCPAVLPDVAAVDRYRVGLEAVLDAHRGGLPLSPASALASGCIPPFQLAHHGRDCRALKTKYATLFAGVFPGRAPARRAGAPRIGFVVTAHHEGGFLRGTAGIVDRLDPGLARVAIFAAPSGMAALKAGIRRPDAEFVAIPDRLPDASDAIAAAGCDVLYHWQIGTDPLNYFLPFARPAPVQCTSWGTHVTSGIPAVRHYLSSELIETPGSGGFYSEDLVRMATLPTFQPPVLRPGSPALRSEFGLPEGLHLYACLQRPAKLHPDLDPLLAGILRRDPEGLVLLLNDGAMATERLRRRHASTMPDVANRVIFLPKGNPAAYLRLLSLADVALDPPHYGAGLTAYDILGLGVPLVTMPGALHVGRYALGCYRKMGIPGAVAGSGSGYVELATRMGTDRDYREAAAVAIARAVPALFEDPAAVREHGAYFEGALELARSRDVGAGRDG